MQFVICHNISGNFSWNNYEHAGIINISKLKLCNNEYTCTLNYITNYPPGNVTLLPAMMQDSVFLSYSVQTATVVSSSLDLHRPFSVTKTWIV